MAVAQTTPSTQQQESEKRTIYANKGQGACQAMERVAQTRAQGLFLHDVLQQTKGVQFDLSLIEALYTKVAILNMLSLLCLLLLLL